MKNILKILLATVFAIAVFQSCSISRKTLAFEKIHDFGEYAIDLGKSRRNNKEIIDAGFRKGKPFYIMFDYFLEEEKCDTLIKEEVIYLPKKVSYYLLTDKNSFDITLSEKDVFLLNKLKPVADSLHFCQSDLIKNAKGFKIITKEQVKEILKF